MTVTTRTIGATTFGGDAGTYDLNLAFYDPNLGAGEVTVYVDGVAAGSVLLGDEQATAGVTRSLSMPQIAVPDAAFIEIVVTGEAAPYTAAETLTFSLVDTEADWGDAAENVVLLEETFDDVSSENVVSSDFETADGQTHTDGNDDGALVLREVDLTGYENPILTLDVNTLLRHGDAFDTSGQYADYFQIEVVDSSGSTYILDTFTGSGSVLTGDRTGQTIDLSEDGGLLYDLNETLPAGATSVQVVMRSDISSNNEIINIDNVRLVADTLGSSTIAETITFSERVTLQSEDFDNGSGVLTDSSHKIRRDGLLVNGKNEKSSTFAQIDSDGIVDVDISMTARVQQGGFEAWGTRSGDVIRVELVDGAGRWVATLEEFSGTGNTLYGSAGNVIGVRENTLTYNVPDVLGAFSLRISSDISAGSEKVLFDNFSVSGLAPAELEEAPADLGATSDPAVDTSGASAAVEVDDAFEVLESEGAGDVDGNVLDNDQGLVGGEIVGLVNGEAAGVGTAVAGSNGGLFTVNADGSLDFDANGEFDGLDEGQTATTSVTYAIAGAGGNTAVYTFTGPSGFDARVIVSELNGDLVFQVEVLTDGGDIGDLRGLFFDIANDGLLSGLSISGPDVTDSRIDANSVKDLGNGNNVKGEVASAAGGGFDVGVELGSQGMSGDDIRSTTFTLSHPDGLTVDQVQGGDMALRATSVGEEGGGRGGSLKLLGEEQTDQSFATVTVTVTGEGDVVIGEDPELTLAPETYGIFESEDVTGANVVEGDALARTIEGTEDGDLPFTGGQADTSSEGTPVVTGFSASTAPDSDGFVATLQAAPEVGVPVDVVVSNGTDSYTGTLTLNADGSFSFVTTDFEGLAQGETVSFTIDYTAEVGTGAGQAQQITFDDLLNGPAWDGGGTLVSDQYPGVTITSTRGSDTTNRAMVFNSDPGSTTGGDGDLNVDQGGVLIVSEDLNGSDPDDNAWGGTFVFEFDGPRTLTTLDFIDTEEPKPTVTLEKADGTTVTFDGPVTGDSQAERGFDLAAAAQAAGGDATDVVKMTVTVAGSGALDNLNFVEPGPAVTDQSTITVTVVGEDGPGQDDATLTLAPETYGLRESEDLAGANVVAGDTLARTIEGTEDGDLDFTGGQADTSSEGTPVVTGFSASTAPDSDGFVATLQAAPEVGVPVDVVVSNGTDSYTGTLTLNADGSFSFVTTDFEGLAQGETVSFTIDYTAEVGTGAGQAQQITFDDLLNGPAWDGGGTLVSDQYPGVTITSTRGSDTTNRAMVFNSDPGSTTGGDGDLNVDQGGVLIVSEDLNGSDPDDNAWGGTFTFDFDAPKTLGTIDFIDTEEPTPTVTLVKSDGTTVTFNGPVTADGTVSPGFDLAAAAEAAGGDATDVVQMVITLAGSGAIDNLSFSDGGTPLTAESSITVTVVGEAEPGGTITGQAFNDTDRDGQFEDTDNETTRPGVTVELVDGTGTVVATTTTDPDGQYSFTDVPEGDYTVRFGPEDGLEFTEANVGDDATDSDADPDTGEVAVTVTGGQTTDNVDAGYITPTGTIAGKAFEDPGGDGFQDGTDPGREGVTVTVTNTTTGETTTTTTGPDGSYEVTDLEPGEYEVTFSKPDDQPDFTNDPNSDDTPDDTITASDVDPDGKTTVTVTGGETTEVDAGFTSSSVGDRVWLDLDEDGIQDAGEAGLEGVTVNLYTADDVPGLDAPAATTVTGADGFYEFDGLAAGDYVIQVLSDDYAVTAQDQGPDDAIDSDIDASGVSGVFSLAVGQARTDIDAGLRGIDISGQAFEDFFGTTGLFDTGAGDTPLGGVTVEAITTDEFGNEIVAGSALTDGSGQYEITGLAAGDYTVRFSVDGVGDSVEFTAQDVDNPAQEANDSDVDATGEVVLGPIEKGADKGNVDAGVTSGIIGDRVWVDTDGDGIQDTGELGLAGVTVNLLDPDTGLALETQVTDENGIYRFEGLLSGSYLVEVVNPDDALYDFSPEDQGTDDGIDSDVDATGLSALIDLAVGEVNTSIDAGLVEVDPMTGQIGDFIFFDADGDGIQDPGEGGVAGVEVALFVAGTQTQVGDTQITGTDGLYLFDGLAAGNYEVRVTENRADLEFTLSSQGGDDGLDSDVPAAAVTDNGDGTTTGRIGTISLQRGEQDLTNDAGLRVIATGVIGDTVFLDANADGIQDAGDSVLSGVTVNLFKDGAFLASDVTDGAGLYRFEGLEPGSYEVEFVNPDATIYEFSPQNAGLDETVDSDADTAGLTGAFTLGVGEENLDVDAGLIDTTTLVPEFNLGGEITIGSRLETQAIVAIVDVSDAASQEGDFTSGGAALTDANNSGRDGTGVDAALLSLAEFAADLVAQGRGDQKIAIVTNSREGDSRFFTGVPDSGSVNRTITEFEGQPITAQMIADEAGADFTGLASSTLFQAVADTPDDTDDTISVGDALDDAVSYLAGQGAETNQVVMLTSSSGYSDELNRNGSGDEFVPGKLAVFPQPGGFNPDPALEGRLSEGIFAIELANLTNPDDALVEGNTGVLYSSFWERDEPVILKTAIEEAAAAILDPSGTDPTAGAGAEIRNLNPTAGTADLIGPDGTTIGSFNVLQAVADQKLIAGYDTAGTFEDNTTFFDGPGGIFQGRFGGEGTLYTFVLDNDAWTDAALQGFGIPLDTVYRVDPSLIYDNANQILIDPTDYSSLTNATLPDDQAGVTSVVAGATDADGDTEATITSSTGQSVDTYLDIVITNRESVLTIDSTLFTEAGGILDEIAVDGLQVRGEAPFGLANLVDEPDLLDAGDIVDFAIVGVDAAGTELGTVLDSADAPDAITADGDLLLPDTTVTGIEGADGYKLKVGLDTDFDGTPDQQLAADLVEDVDGNVNFVFNLDDLSPV